MKSDNDIFDSSLSDAMKRLPRERLTAADHANIMARVQQENAARGVSVCGVEDAACARRERWRQWTAAAAVLLFVTGLGQKMIYAALGWLLTPDDLARVHLPAIPWREVASTVAGLRPHINGDFTRHINTGFLSHIDAGNIYIVIAACILLLLAADAAIRRRVRN